MIGCAGRVPPHDLDSEAAVLSATMLDSLARDEALDLLRPQHFYSDANRIIFKACQTLAQAGTPIDAVSVNSWLRDRQLIAQVGGPTYLAQLVDATPAVANVAAHAQRVVGAWQLRRAIAACHELAALGYQAQADVAGHLDRCEAVLSALREAEPDDPQPVAATLPATCGAMALGAEPGLSTGLADLDGITGGLRGGDLLVLAARPGMGKTSLALQIAQHVAVSGTALFASLEMPRRQLEYRLLAAGAGLDLRLVRQHKIGDHQWRDLHAAADRLSRLRLWIDDSPGLTLQRLRARARRLRTGGGLGLIVVDYLQLVRGDRQRSREEEVAALCRGLKALARDLDVPVLALAQLSRRVEATAHKRPTLSDLRESGAIEADADAVLLLYRPGYYQALAGKQDDTGGKTELIVAKQRQGPTGIVLLRFLPRLTVFEAWNDLGLPRQWQAPEERDWTEPQEREGQW